MSNIGHNVFLSDEEVQGKLNEMLEIERQRKKLNKQMGEIRETLKEKGFHSKSIALVLQMAKVDDHDRRQIFGSTRKLADQYGLNAQGDLFEPRLVESKPEDSKDELAKAKKKKAAEPKKKAA